MEDNEFSPSMDSESEDDGLLQDGMEAQIVEDEFSTRNTAHPFDDGENERVSQGTEEEEEEMDYTSGNEYQEDVGETSVREGDMFYSCHEDFHQMSGFSEQGSWGVEGGGPRSPEGSPPESPETAQSGSETAEFDYTTPSETDTSVRLQSERLEREGEEEDGRMDHATPASPMTSTAESADEIDQSVTQESEGLEFSESRDEESDMFDRGGDEKSDILEREGEDEAPSSSADVAESSEEIDETVKSPSVPCYGQDEYSYDHRTGVGITSGTEQSSQELQDDEVEEKYRGEQLFQEGDGIDRLSKLPFDEENGNDNNQNDQSTEDVDTRTLKDDDRLHEDRDDEQVLHKDHHKNDTYEDDEDHLDLTVPTETTKTSRKSCEHSDAAVVEVLHIEDHGDELDFEEDVDDHAQPDHRLHSGEQVDEDEDDEEEKKDSVVGDEKVDDQLKKSAELEESEGEGEVKDDDDGECNDAEEGEDGELDDDDMEEGEVKDPVEKKKPEVRPTCRFFTRGQCFWGNSCRFIHPGINDKGNYSLIDRRELHNAQAVLLGQPLEPPSPPPKEDLPPPPPEEEEEFLPPPPEEPRPESAWERGLRHARELRKKAMELKEKGVLPEEQKTIGDMIDEENDYDKENEFFPEKGDVDDAYMQGEIYPPEQYPYPLPPEHYERNFNFREQQPSPPRQVYRVQQDFNDPRRRMMNQSRQRNDWQQNNFNRNRQQQFRGQRPQQQQQQQQQQPPFRRGRSPGNFGDKRRDERPGAMRNLPRRDKPGMRAGDGSVTVGKASKDKAADSWQDPWARNKSPGKKNRSAFGGGRRPRSRSNSSASYSDRSYSSRSRSRSDSRSRSRSYSSRSRSSSRSSYSGSSRSRSRSRSKSPGSQSYSSFSSRSRSRSPPPKPKGRLGAAKPIAKPGMAQIIAKPGVKPPVKASPKPIPSSKPTQSQQQRSQAPPQGRPPASKAVAGRPAGAKQPIGRPPGGQPAVRKPVGSGAPQPKTAPTRMSDKQQQIKSKPAFPKPVPMNRRSRSRTRSESLSSISSRSSYSSYSRSRSRSLSRSRSRSYSGSSSSSRSRSRSRSRSLTRSRPGAPRPGQPRAGQIRPGQPRPGQLRQGQARPGQPRPAQPRPGQPRPGLERSGPPRSVPSRPEAVRQAPSRPAASRPAGARSGTGMAAGRPPPRRSRSYSGSRSRSRSSSISSRSSVSSADSENMYANLASPVSSASSTEMPPVPKRGTKITKGSSKPPSAVSSTIKSRPPQVKQDRITKPASKSSPQTMRVAASKKITKVPVGKATPDRSAVAGKVQPRGAPAGKSLSKPSSGERPSSSTKLQGAQRPSSTTTQQPKTKPMKGIEGKTGERQSEQKMRERGPPVAISSSSRPSSNQQGILKLAARKEIKLNLISKPTEESKKRPAEPSNSTRPEKKSKIAPDREHKVGSSTVKQQATSSTDVKHSKVTSSDRKRASSPPSSKTQTSKAPKPALKPALKPAQKKESLSRREEILKQLQAVEDLIRKKKSKMK